MSHRDDIESMFKAVNARDYDGVARSLAEGCEFRAPGAESVTGVDGIVGYMRPFLEAFPDLTHEIVAYVEDGDTAAFELRISGTHTAPLASPQGEIPATGKSVEFQSCDFVRMRGDQIVSYHVYFDMMGFMGQLGLLG
ncbi:MAG: hypothetical protein QOG87_3684 [Actinomycetota bacterium]|jgi:predicted ester cyclase